jgi:hypothetical protein
MAEIIEANRRRWGPRSNLPGAIRRSRSIRLAWLALVGFVLGVSLGPFSPMDSGKNRLKSNTEDTLMNPFMQNTAAAESTRPEQHPAPGIETATFAMG